MPAHVLAMLISESTLIALAGGLLGALGARYLFGTMDLNAMTMGFLQVLDVTWGTVL